MAIALGAALLGCRSGPMLGEGYRDSVYPHSAYGPAWGQDESHPRSVQPVVGDGADEQRRADRLATISDLRVRVAQSGEPLTLEECLALALGNSLSLRHSELEIERARTLIDRGYLSLIPTLTVDGTVLVHTIEPRIRIGDTTTAVGDQVVVNGRAALDIPMWSFGRTTHALRMYEHQEAAAEAGRRGAQQQTVLRVLQLVLTVHKLRETVDVLDRSIETIESQAHAARAFFEQGLVTENDVLVAEVALSERRQDRREMLTAQRTAIMRLNALLGFDIERDTRIAPVGLPGTPPLIDAVLPADEAVRLALEHRPDLARARQLVAAAEREVSLADRQRRPTLFGFAEYNVTSDSYAPTSNSGVVGARLGWTLFSGVNEGNVRLAEVQQGMQHANLSVLEREAIVGVHAAYLNVRDKHRRVAVAERRVVQAEENLRILRARYEVQVASAERMPELGALVTGADVLEAEALRTQALAGARQARYDEWLAWAELEAQVGTRLAPHWKLSDDEREQR